MATRRRERTPYATQAEIFLRQAHEEFAQGDLRQASEKGWGAASQIVKAIAEARGLSHKSHADLFDVVSSLKNPQFNTGFAFANALHTNFYEGWMNKDLVGQYLEGVDTFIGELVAAGFLDQTR